MQYKKLGLMNTALAAMFIVGTFNGIFQRFDLVANSTSLFISFNYILTSYALNTNNKNNICIVALVSNYILVLISSVVLFQFSELVIFASIYLVSSILNIIALRSMRNPKAITFDAIKLKLAKRILRN